MERRFVVFLIVASALIIGYGSLMQWMYPPRQLSQKEIAVRQAAEKEKASHEAKLKEAGEKKSAEIAAKDAGKQRDEPAAEMKAAPEPEVKEQWVALGSADAKAPYRMLVMLTNRGAAVARIELNSPRYCDVDDRSGFLGHLTIDGHRHAEGCPVDVVGPGTPAEEAGLKPGDIIKSLNAKPIADSTALEAIMAKTKPGRTVKLVVLRGGKELTLSAKLRRRPLEVIRPERDDPLSMLLTLQQIDKQKLNDQEKANQEKWEAEDKDRKKGTEAEELEFLERRHLGSIGAELKGVSLRTANWRILPTVDKDIVQFRRALPDKGIEITKTYRLARVPSKLQQDPNCPAYHLEFEIEVRNVGRKAHKVAYRLDGPNGLPLEGKWYASKVSRNWSGSGLRDYVASFGGRVPEMIGPSTIAADKDLPVRPDSLPDAQLTFVGVDAQYFSAVLMPERPNPADLWLEEVRPIRVGKVDMQHPTYTNTSCRLVSTVADLEPGQKMTHRYRFFAGPKKPAILENKEYRLGELVYYGWPIFAMFAVPLTAVLHFFYAIVWNYGLAIVLLTVLVRGCMFPLSLKQVAGAQKMQMIQPEIKRLAEKHKNDSQARAKAQQELFRKHNYNPASGCLPIFIQLPVFMGLYRCLMVDIELRDAPLVSHAVRWCSNLAGPDMLYDWHSFMPAWFNDGAGMFALGPYFNILPIIAVILMVVQMKKMSPPPADEQAAMQQKMMQYMMLFMGLMFFKMASGLCVYFVVTTLWGFGERKFLPKPATVSPTGPTETRAQAKAQAKQIAAKEKK